MVFVPCSPVVTCWERADLFAVVFVVVCHFPNCAMVHIRINSEVGDVKLVKALQLNILLTIPKRYFFCGSFMFFTVLCLLCLCARLFICAL